MVNKSSLKLLQDYPIQTICIFLFGRLGDIAMRTPIIHQIRSYYPNAKITALVDLAGYELLTTNPEIDELILMERNRKKKISYIISRVSIQMILWKRQFDLVMNLYGGNSSHTMMRLSFSKYQVGYRHGKSWCNLRKLSDLNGQEFLFKRAFHLTNVLYKILVFFQSEAESLDTTPFIFSSSSADTDMKIYLQNFRLNKMYLISLAASDINKILPLEKSYKQIELLYREYSYIPLVVCNPTQEFLQDTLINDFLFPNNIPYVKLPLLSIDAISALIKQVDFTIVPDTGLYHISIGLGRPTFGIFTYTNPILVEPSHGIYELCFQESNILGHDGLKRGVKEIDSEYLLKSTRNFIANLQSN